ncbi:MAG: porin family protein, partial [Bacteroidota bacterium]
GLYIQPELLFSQRRGVFGDSSGKTTTTTLSYIDFPVLAGFKILVFRINAGPNFQFLVGASQSGSGNRDANFSRDHFNSAVVGFQAGIGADLGPFQVDVRYDGSIGNLGKNVVNSSGQKVDYSTRSNMLQITLGYRIFKI